MEVQAKEKKRLSGLKIGSLLIIIFLLLYVPSLLHWFYGEQIETDALQIGTIEDLVNTDAYILRDEEVLKSPFPGKCIIDIGEGEKVASNSVVATILKDSSLPLIEQMEQKEMEILETRMEKSKNAEIFSDDIIKIENEISQKVKQVVKAGSSYDKIGQLKKDINKLIQKKAAIYGGNSASDSYIDGLIKEKNKLQDQINANTKKIYSEYSGIVTYQIDGYEEALAPSNMRNITLDDIAHIKLMDNGKINSIKSVDVNKPFAKIIKDFDAYLLLVLDKEKADKYKVDDRIQEIRINQISKIIDGTVFYKSSEESGKCILAIKIDKGISETAGFRKVNIDLVKTSYKGLKVPLTSLTDINEEDMTAKIIINKANYSSVRSVKIIGRNEDFAVIEGIQETGKSIIGLYDIYVLNPQNIQEGQLIN